MAKFTKAILRAKTHHSPDGKVPVTAERLKHWADTFKLMDSRKWHSSTHFDHQDDPSQQQLVQMGPKGKPKRGAMNAVGRCIGFDLGKDELGDFAKITLDLPDPKAAEKARLNVVEVSPVIKQTAKDGDENIYHDAIVSFDLVTQPVDNTQGPFVEVEDTIACSLRMVDDDGKATVYRMSNPFEDDDDEEGGEGNDDDTETLPSGDDAAAADKNPDLPKVVGDERVDEAIRAHLEQLGLGVPSDWTLTSEGAGNVLLGCLKTLVNAQQKAEAEQASDKGDKNENSEEDDMGKLADPGFAAMSLLTDMRRERLKEQIEKLRDEGRCTVDEANKQLESLTTYRLSLSTDNKPEPADIDKWIESRKPVPAGTFWDEKTRTANQQHMSLNVVAPGSHQQLDKDAEGVEYGMKLMGLKKAAK
jgi:hypothetical protein